MLRTTISNHVKTIATAFSANEKSITIIKNMPVGSGFYTSLVEEVKEELGVPTNSFNVIHVLDLRDAVDEINAVKNSVVILNIECIGITDYTQMCIDNFLKEIKDGILCVFVHND